MVSKPIGELIVGICMIIVEAVPYIASAEIPEKSATYPKTLIVMAFVFTCAFMVRNVLRIKKEGLHKDGLPIAKKAPGQGGAMLQVIITMAIIFLYVFSMPYLGYMISTPVFVLGIMLYFGMRNIFALILTPLSLTLFGVLVFNNLLYIFLPRGVILG